MMSSKKMRFILTTIGKPKDIVPDTAIHRVGGGNVANLRLKSMEKKLIPSGISVFLGGSPQQVAAQLRQVFPRSRKWRGKQTVGTTTASALRQAGFEVVPNPTSRFSNHARLIHPNGVAGFTDTNLKRLAQTFQDTRGC